MSAILPPEHHADWLHPNQHDTALPLDPVRPAPPEGWNPEPASRRANSPHDDDPGLIEPPTPAQPAPQATSDTTRQGAQPPLARPSAIPAEKLFFYVTMTWNGQEKSSS